VLGAKRAGMVTVWLNRHGARWAHVEKPDIEVATLDALEDALDALVAQRAHQEATT
jgi:FMN phosphatase YigB (HAD superfamily)